MKKIIFIILFLVSTPAHAFGFDRMRPRTAEVPEYKLTIGLGFELGFTNITSLKDTTIFIDALTKLSMPEGDDFFVQMYGFIASMNGLYNKKVNLTGVSLPIRILGICTKWFELTLDGGIINFSKAKVNGLEKKLDGRDIEIGEDWVPYLVVNPQSVLKLTTTTLLGGEVRAIGKYPIKVGKYTITPLAGVVFSVGYIYNYTTSFKMDGVIRYDSGFTRSSQSGFGMSWTAGGVLGAQFDGFKYLRPRIMFQFSTRLTEPYKRGTEVDKTFSYDIGVDLKIWKIATVRAEVLDMLHPEYRVEVSRGFLGNNEIAVGGVFNSDMFNDMGYVILGLGGKFIKVTTTAITNGKQFGLLFGLKFGYMPQ